MGLRIKIMNELGPMPVPALLVNGYSSEQR